MSNTTDTPSIVNRQSSIVNTETVRNTIFIKGARANNLKNIDLDLPKNKLIVVTGVSGSGKSSITMDTLFAEGQRRYVESLSSYARQFLGRMKKPDVDYIKGICPAIAIEQKTSTSNARSTVGTLTEIYDYLRLLYARAGRTYSPISGEEVKRHSVTDVVDFIEKQPEGTKVQLFIPLPVKYQDRTLSQELNLLLQKGYSRIFWEGELQQIQDIVESKEFDLQKTLNEYHEEDIRILIDRFVVTPDDEDIRKQIGDSVQTALYESEGECLLTVDSQSPITNHQSPIHFNTRFELDGMEFIEPNPQLFNFNNPVGACPTCEGFSRIMGISEEKVVPDPTKSVYEGAVACWVGEKYGELLKAFLKVAHHFDFPVHTAYQALTKEQQRLLWTGNKHFEGISAFFKELEANLYKIQNRVMLARYRGRTVCTTCGGSRLRPEATYVKVAGRSITELVEMPVDELLVWFESIVPANHHSPITNHQLTEHERKIASRLLLEIKNRLRFMCDVGLKYLTINRLSASLSGGETQRINLTRTLGSNLTASMYILDEPSVGLHPRDTGRLVEVLKELRDLGNTVVVVEHEEDVIKAADYLVDIGPAAGKHGGELVFAGPYERIYEDASESLTTKYMSGRMSIPVPKVRRKSVKWIELKGCRENNLKNIDIKIPLNTLSVVSGVSGSGKTTLVKDILYPALKKHFDEPTAKAPGQHSVLSGDLKALTQVEMVNQSPIGKSSRSNPVTYVKAYDAIRNLMANQQLSKIRGYKPGHFSFNVEGGRCDTCQGEGEQVIEMQFLADVRLECEDCKGKRFKPELLDVQYKGKNIFEILSLSVEEALDFFKENKEVINKIQPLFDVGLGYVQLGQSSSTLSGGEAQRVKLASFLQSGNAKNPVLFIFDEPTTGLHFHDIRTLLGALNALVENGHSVLVVEHNMEVIKCADWVIDLGPDGGKDGGNLVFQGAPEGLVKVEGSWTGKFLGEKLG
ncbi:MAG: excinuclease ABC subunit UvrA [Saprospiraceae bacterium]|nr:excinuclease ABC subunit UvrA [Saprospiraceae bacterium]MCF8251350.1 excinuclease ABC subunit UvrA [Saprospiraceae bacterium]MCF8280525.1 excinuclease ABC subunit UvrA [Bacteroidales bacterium]MCF8313257.1 excinuclease ABC subunit UvrA [Saprospiraceae bacterium]MCF8441704.1 excinuclease ABC subunit UvrA [Saprospiraceae bacterium]